VAEHHAVPGIASGSPPVLMAAIAARTARIRVGSGGVMLPNHQPLIVAEQFAMLDALFPSRIDLGVGRSLGFTAPVRKALRRDADAPDTFVADLDELRAYLDGRAAVTARPRLERPVPVFVLATGRGLALQGTRGCPWCWAGRYWTAPMSVPHWRSTAAASGPRAGGRTWWCHRTCWSPTRCPPRASSPSRRRGRWPRRVPPGDSPDARLAHLLIGP
jgi:luciferase family oxidoreductase group 1